MIKYDGRLFDRILLQVTTVCVENLPGCSLSTLAHCPRLQSLTLRGCGLRALEGLGQCVELRYVDVQVNTQVCKCRFYGTKECQSPLPVSGCQTPDNCYIVNTEKAQTLNTAAGP